MNTIDPQSAKLSKITLLGLIIIVMVILITLLAPWITPYDYAQQNIANNHASPMTGYTITQEQVSSCHWYETSIEWGCTIFLLGSDPLGRDIFSRLIYSVRTSLIIGFSVAIISLTVGTTYGMVSAYLQLHPKRFTRYIDDLMTIFIDFLSAFPPIIMIIIMRFYFYYFEIMQSVSPTPNAAEKFQSMLWETNETSRGMFFIIIVISVSQWIQAAKLAKRVSISAFKNRNKSKHLDTSNVLYGFTFRDTLRDIKKTVFMFTVIAIPVSILTESALSFLGPGVLAPFPSFGNMLRNSYLGMKSYPYYFFSTVFMLLLTVIGFNLVTHDMKSSSKPLLPKED